MRHYILLNNINIRAPKSKLGTSSDICPNIGLGHVPFLTLGDLTRNDIHSTVKGFL